MFRTGLPYLLLILVLLAAPAASGQDSARFTMHHYTDEDGLPQNSVLSIAGDEEGFIWMTTENGLVRFDGHNFFIYNNTNTGISTNRFTDIVSSVSDDHLYAANINRDQFQHVLIKGGRAVLARRFDAEKQAVLRRTDYKGTGLYETTEFIPAGRNRFYVIGAASVTAYLDGRGRRYRIPRDTLEFHPFFLIGRQLFYKNKQQQLFCCDRDGGREMHLAGDLAYMPEHAYATTQWTVPGKPTYMVVNDAVYVLQYHSGDTIRTRRLIDRLPTRAGDIKSVYEDSATGVIFIGTAINGLYEFVPRRFRAYGIDDTPYYSQTAISDSAVYTPDRHLFRAGRPPVRFLSGRIPGIDKYASYTDQEGFVYLCGLNLMKMDPATQQIVRQWPVGAHLFSLAPGLDDRLWIATREDHIFYLDTRRPGDSLHLLGRFPKVSCMLEAERGQLWVGAYNGLYLYDTESRQLDTIHALDGMYVRSFYADKDGNIWITTYEDGWYLLHNNRVLKMPDDKDGYLASAHCILEDNRGFFWITTNKGLFQAAKSDLLDYAAGKLRYPYYMYYGKDNGFNTNEFNGGCQPCAVLLKNGYCSLPSLNGLVWFRPDSIRSWLPDKGIFLDRMELNGSAVPVATQLFFKGHFDLLNIWVSTPYLGDHRNVHFYYRVRPGKQDWWPVSANGVISLQGFNAGKYVVEIMKRDGFGGDRGQMKTIRIVVAPYWYQTWWFSTLVLLAVAVLIYLVIRIRTRLLRRRNHWLELQIKRRTQKLEHTLETLNASQAAQTRQAYVQQRLIAAISHDVTTPLRFLSIINRKLYEALLTETTDRDILEMSRSASDSSGRMQDYLSNLLQYVKTTSYSNKADYTHFNLYQLVAGRTGLFLQIARENGTQIEVDIDRQQAAYSNAQLLAIILHNLIDNAVKHTLNGSIRISCEAGEKKMCIFVRDSGTGVPGDVTDWVNSRLPYPEGSPGATEGIGLFIVRELASLIQATLTMRSSQHGTEVEICLDYGAA